MLISRLARRLGAVGRREGGGGQRPSALTLCEVPDVKRDGELTGLRRTVLRTNHTHPLVLEPALLSTGERCVGPMQRSMDHGSMVSRLT